MFKVAQSPTFSWPVEIEVPGEGKPAKHRIELTFKRISQSELDELSKSSKSDADTCREVVCGWKGVQDEDGKELDFSPVNLNRLLDVSGVAYQIIATFYYAMEGAARRKNLLALRGTGA